MRLKKNKDLKTERINARCTELEKNKIEIKAMLYCDGNLNDWLIYAALNFLPGKEDLDEKETQPRKAGKKKR